MEPSETRHMEPVARLRDEVLRAAMEMTRRGLSQGTAGNVSLRARLDDRNVIAITPSGIPYEHLTAASICMVDESGSRLEGSYVPSSELPMHLSVYQRRTDVGAVVHTHSTYATTFAVLGRPVRAVHYRLSRAGNEIPVASYARYGSNELGQACVRALGTGRAVLLRNHGVVAVGKNLGEALDVASAVEETAELEWRACLLGEPTVLSAEQMRAVSIANASYGQPVGASLS